jgi:hypothetical protein
MRTHRPTALIFSTLLSLPIWAQQPQPPASSPPAWSVGPIDFSGLVDGYYSFNFNHPATRNNNLRYFDAKANQASLNMAKLTTEHSADPAGFKLELIFGRAADLFHATEPAGIEVYKHLLQAYVIVKPAGWRGVQFDFGKFVTSAGAEVTETHLNWNYSRGLLYANGPFYHFGARLAVPVHSNFTLGYQLVNGWNNVEDNNSGKTQGFAAGLTTSRVNWFNNYYAGPEKTNTNEGWRHFYDTVFAINPNGRVNALLNFDYGHENNPGRRASKFYGVLGAVRVPLGERMAFSPRYEWYKDRDGLITGTAQTLQEITLTLEYRMQEGFLGRLEYRRDWSSHEFFDRGNETASQRNQDTLLIGFVVYFRPKRS